MTSLLRAGYTDLVINDAALVYKRDCALAGPVIRQLASQPQRRFVDQAAWKAHLDRLGISALRVTPDPRQIATEGAFWGQRLIHASGWSIGSTPGDRGGRMTRIVTTRYRFKRPPRKRGEAS